MCAFPLPVISVGGEGSIPERSGNESWEKKIYERNKKKEEKKKKRRPISRSLFSERLQVTDLEECVTCEKGQMCTERLCGQVQSLLTYKDSTGKEGGGSSYI